MAKTTHTEWRDQLCEQWNLFTLFCSIRRPYFTFKLPRGDMDMPPRLHNFFWYLAIGMCHFRHLWNGMCDHHRAEITVMQFTGHSLLVHHSEVGPSPCPILSAELTCAISFDYWPLGCVSLVDGTVRIFFTLSHIVSQAVFYKTILLKNVIKQMIMVK